MKQDHVHQYVLERIAGLPAHLRHANRLAKTIATTSVLLTASVITITIISGSDIEIGTKLALAMLIAGFPFGILTQRYTARKVLHRHNLAIERFMIGKKEYLVPAHGTLNHELDIFAAASSLVGSSNALETSKHAAAWHTYQVSEEINGVAICLGWFGPEGKPYAFIYGDTKSVTDITAEVWDIGHIRQIHDSDVRLYMKTAKTWRTQSTLPVTVAFAPLSTNTVLDDVTLTDIKMHSTLLGLLQLKGTRSDHQTFSPQLASAMRTAAHMQLLTSLGLMSLLSTSFIGYMVFSVPPLIGLLQVIAINAALLPLLLSSVSWDGIRHHHHKGTHKQISDTLTAVGLLIAISIGQFIIFMSQSSQGIQAVTAYSTIHNTAMSAIVTTIIGCLLVELFMRRPLSLKMSSNKFNPFFMLAAASALLLTALTAYTTGPLTETGLAYVGGGIASYLLVRSLQRYAGKHHSREHIIELLTQR